MPSGACAEGETGGRFCYNRGMTNPAAGPEDHSLPEVDGIEFRKWAEFGTQEYGRTPWFFLRELAQNARDAGARSIDVDAGRDETGREYLAFGDDGAGMSWVEACRFLFRLYSSSKDRDEEAAGKYGIGFWTVLHFDPEEIRIFSRQGREGWGIALDRDLRSRTLSASPGIQGTRIMLVRRPLFPTAAEFTAEVRRELIHHCGFIRGRQRRPLSLRFQGEKVNREFTLPGPVVVRYREGHAETVAGLGEQPLVRLYARGLFIWEGRFLEEISGRSESSTASLAKGVYPVLLLDSDRLDGTIFRREALAGKELQKLLHCAEQALNELLVSQVRRAYPRTWRRRLIDTLARERRRLLWASMPLLAVFLFLFIFKPTLPSLFQGKSAPPTPSSVILGETEAGPVPPLALRLRYMPPDPLYFRFFAAERYESGKGFQSEPDQEDTLPATTGTQIALELSGFGENLYLPVPTGFRLLFDSLDPPLITGLGRIRPGEHSVLLEFTRRPRRIRYRCAPERIISLSTQRISRLTELPGSLRERLQLIFPIEAINGAAANTEVIGLVSRTLREGWGYEPVPVQALHGATERGRNSGWYERVEAGMRGDCDVLNGVAALYFRYFSIPARLAVGVTGQEGKGSDILHSWVEYHDGVWRVFDATRIVSAATAPAAATVGNGKKRWPLSLLLAMALSVPALLFVLHRWRRRKGVGIAADCTPAQARRMLGDLAVRMIENPEFWKGNPVISDIPFIPVLRGRFLSLREAARLARRSRLYKGGRENRLARTLAGRGFVVLDAGAADFSSFFQVFPRVRDLDAVDSLGCRRPQPMAVTAEEQLLASVNRRIARIDPGFPPFLLASTAPAELFRLISLQPAGSRRSATLPPRFFAISAMHPALAELARKWRSEPELAEFGLVMETVVRYRLPLVEAAEFQGRFADSLLRRGRGR